MLKGVKINIKKNLGKILNNEIISENNIYIFIFIYDTNK